MRVALFVFMSGDAKASETFGGRRHHWTVMVPVIDGWTSQKYAKVPAVVKVLEND